MKKKTFIIIGVFIILYVIIGAIFLRQTVDVDVGFDMISNGDFDVAVGKTRNGYQQGEMIIYHMNEEYCRYKSEIKNSVFSKVLLWNDEIYIAGYTINKDKISTEIILYKMDNECNKIKKVVLESNQEIYITDMIVSDASLYVLSNTSGTSINSTSYETFGEYDVLLIQLDESLEIITIDSYGSEQSELATDIFDYDGVLYVAVNQYNDLVQQQESSTVYGYIIGYEGDFIDEKVQYIGQLGALGRIQGLTDVDGGSLLYGYTVDDGVKTATYCYFEGDCYTMTEQQVGSEYIDAIVIDGSLYLQIEFERYSYSSIYGNLKRSGIVHMDDDEIQMISNIKDDLYVEQLHVFENEIYVAGYDIEHRLILADQTRYYYNKITKLSEITD